MAVPAEIRAVPRPVNTIVDDSGTNSPKRYAVRQRASSKYIPGGNPQPKNGKVIGSNPQRAHKRGCKVYEWSRTVVGEVKPLAGKSFPIYVTIEQIFVVIERDVIDKSVG